MSTIILVRPGCTDYDEQHRVQGTLDIPLNARGAQQVHLIAAELHDVPLDVLLAAPCAAARETASLLAKDREVPFKTVEELRNVNLGLWQGLCIEELRRKHPRVFRQCHDAPQAVCPPEGETLEAAAERVRQVLARPLRKRLNFGIVVPEPLAGVVRCIIQGRSLDEVEWLGHSSRPWEILASDSTAAPLETPSGFFRRLARAPATPGPAPVAIGVEPEVPGDAPHGFRGEAPRRFGGTEP